MMRDATDSGCTVFIVDDDEPMRDSLALMLGLLGYRAASFASAEALLAAYQDNWTGCLVADLKLPGKSGIELQAELRARGSQLPFVIITAHGGVSSARAAFQADAVDFLEKPFDEADLRAAIEKGLAKELGRMQRAAADSENALKLAKLTRREREVLQLAGKGLHAKEIARARHQSTHGGGAQSERDGQARRAQCCRAGALCNGRGKTSRTHCN